MTDSADAVTRIRLRIRIAHVARLAVVRWSLRTRGFGSTLALVRRRAKSRPHVEGADGASAAAMAIQLIEAAAWVPWQAKCLEQSLALFWSLRTLGQTPILRIGVNPYGFQAHAWVEVDGEAINEQLDTIRRLRSFPAVLS